MPLSARRERVGGPDFGHLRGLRVLAMAVASIALVGLSGGVAGGTARGRTLWFAAYDGPANGLDAAEGIAASPDGSKVFVTGESWGGSTAFDANTGARTWFARYSGPDNLDDDAFAIQAAPDGSRVYVTGVSHSATAGYDLVTIAYRASTGGRAWVSRYDGPDGLDDFATDLGVAPDGSKLYVTGYSVGASTARDAETIAYDARTGAEGWVSRYNGPEYLDDDGVRLAVSPDGSRVYVAGVSTSAATGDDWVTLSYEAATGDRLWLSSYHGDGDGADHAWAIAVSPDGSRVYVNGFTWLDST